MEVKYYKTYSGRSVLLEFIEGLPVELREEFFEAILKLQKGEQLKMPLSRPLSNIAKGLHELRLKDRSGIYRLFYCLRVCQVVYVIHGFKKKTDKLPIREIRVIHRRLKEIR